MDRFTYMHKSETILKLQLHELNEVLIRAQELASRLVVLNNRWMSRSMRSIKFKDADR